MSPTSQNRLIGIVTKCIIQRSFTQEIKEVKHRSISSDEVTSVHVYMYICICVCVYMCMCVYVYMFVYVYLYFYMFKYM